MSKHVVFNDNDNDLVKKIEKYQKEKNLTFVGAVRDLCNRALKLNEITK